LADLLAGRGAGPNRSEAINLYERALQHAGSHEKRNQIRRKVKLLGEKAA
jgi:uncharacterized protein (UPF0262 family)